MTAMRDIYVDKVVVHMGVGESGEKLVKAEEIMKTITTQTPVRTIAKKTQPAFNIRKGAPIGCKVTLRGKHAQEFVKTSLGIIERILFENSLTRAVTSRLALKSILISPVWHTIHRSVSMEWMSTSCSSEGESE